MAGRGENPPPHETHEDRFQHDIEELEAGSGWKGILRGALIVAAALAAAAIVYYAVGRKPPAPRVTTQGTVIIEPLEPPSGKLSAAPTTFRWEAVAGRRDYAFKVLQKGNPIPIVDRSVLESKTKLSDDEIGRLVRGTSYVWVVEARGSDGRVLGSGRGFFDF